MGSVSSLLEVGTGFHPELTGRENIFLNGAILGMTQREIRKKFDEIVAFAEVEKFLDTPVKHYSSGMYVRLAFAVAAHLEPEILIVDEVLAVGDAEFQKKCLGKMDEVSRTEGRTILFVSHDMEAVSKLCTRAIFLEKGGVRAAGDVKMIVPDYLHSQSSSPRVIDLTNRPRPHYCLGKARLVRASPSAPEDGWSMPFGHQFSLDLAILVDSSLTRVEIRIGLFSDRGFEVASWTNNCSNKELLVRPGTNTFRIAFQDLLVLPGQYSVGIDLLGERGIEDSVQEAVIFEITASPETARIKADTLGGAIVPRATISALD